MMSLRRMHAAEQVWNFFKRRTSRVSVNTCCEVVFSPRLFWRSICSYCHSDLLAQSSQPPLSPGRTKKINPTFDLRLILVLATENTNPIQSSFGPPRVCVKNRRGTAVCSRTCWGFLHLGRRKRPTESLSHCQITVPQSNPRFLLNLHPSIHPSIHGATALDSGAHFSGLTQICLGEPDSLQ